MSNLGIIRISVDNPDELLAAGAYGAGALIRIQSGPAATGPFTNISPATVALVAGQTMYLAYDQAATGTTWYQTRFENAGGTVVSAWSAPFEASGASGYCSLLDAKVRLGIADTDDTDDDVLSSLIGETAAAIEGKTGRTFYRDPIDGTSGVFLYDGWATEDGGQIAANGRCFIESRGLVSLTLVEVALTSGDAANGVYHTIPTTDWYLRPVRPAPGWPFTELWITNIPSTTDSTPAFFPGFNTVRLTGIRGWPAIPPDIEAVNLSLAVSAYRARGAGGGDAYQVATDGARTFERMLSADDRRVLERYTLREALIV